MITTTGSFPCGLMHQEVCNDPIEMEHVLGPLPPGCICLGLPVPQPVEVKSGYHPLRMG
jgi:hypothetical protein